MSVWSVLLRLLLSACLVLNGMTAALASAHLPGMHPGMTHTAIAATPSAAPVEAMPPCHHGHAPAMEHADAPPHDAAMATTAHATGHAPAAAPDCCKSDRCDCACVHAAPATLPLAVIAPLLLDADRSARALPLGHAAPALPDPIRPPIG